MQKALVIFSSEFFSFYPGGYSCLLRTVYFALLFRNPELS